MDLCRKYKISDATFYKWHSKYGGLGVSEAKRLRSDGLGPAEAFLDPLVDALTHGVAAVTGGASVYRRASAGVVLRHVRTDVHAAQPLHELNWLPWSVLKISGRP